MRNFLYLLLISLASIAYAQKIPFQGKLTDDGDPVSGVRTFEFGFEASSWKEVHTDVEVLDGFYSVVLGSITPLPDSLFAGSDQAQLTIKVGDIQLSPITIYLPYKQKLLTDHFDGTNDQAALMIKRTGAAGSRFAALETISEMEGSSYALYGQATGSGDNYGVYGYSGGTGLINLGVLGIARGAGNGTMSDFTGTDPIFGSYNTGLRGVGSDNLNGNTGVYGQALGGVGKDNIGVVGRSNVNDSSSTIRNVGTLGDAIGPGVNIGIHGMASRGAENWAGWFDGDVNVNGSLMINGNPIGGNESVLDSIITKDLKIFNNNGGLRSHLNYYEPNDAGSLVLYGANDSTNVILGSSFKGYAGFLGLYDSLRNQGARLTVNTKGVGNLYTFDANHKVSGWFGNQGGAGGFMQLVGYNGEGTFTGATYTGLASWNHGLPYFVMEGASESPFTPLVEFGAQGDGAGNEYGYYKLNTNKRVLEGLGSATLLEIDHRTHLPYFQLNGGNDLNWDARIRLTVDSINNLGTAGSFNLLGPLGNDNGDPITMFSVSTANDPNGGDAAGAGAEMFLWGDSSPNFQIGGKPWEENDFASFNMYGSHDNGDGWYQSNLNMDVYESGEYQSVTLNMKNTQSGGVSVETVQVMSNMYNNKGGGLVLRSSTGATTIELAGESGVITATTVNQTSDRRLKTNIQNQQSALDKVKALRGVTFEWKSDEEKHQNIGFIAQEIEKVYPEVVTTKENGYKAVNYAVLVSALVEALKELDAKVAALANENIDLKAQLAVESANTTDIEALKAEIDSIKKILSLSLESPGSKVGQNK